jgi:hypothetical protein
MASSFSSLARPCRSRLGIRHQQVIIDGCREVLSDEAVKALPAEERNFISVIDGLNILMKPPARFVNHSCNPNARGSDRCDTFES